MTEKPFNYDYVGGYTLDEQAEAELIAAQNECTFMWSTKEGWPVGVIMSYIFEQGCFWLSVSSLRVRVQAVERDPRVSIAITSKGTSTLASRALTYKGTCEVFKDQATIDWFLPLLAQKLFVKLNDTPNRRVLKVTPVKRIGYDGQKMRKATEEAVAAGREIGPG